MARMELGVLSSAPEEGVNPFQAIADYGVTATQFSNWQVDRCTPEFGAQLKRDAAAAGVQIAAVWAGYSGPAKWNFIEGPATLGLVPPRYRRRRVSDLQRQADFAAWCGARAIITHCGFIPEDPNDRLYAPTVDAIRRVAQYCLDRGLGFWYETGQETPVTLLRAIEDVDLPNQGINLDTANLVLYGKANPLDALDIIGPWVRNLHAKDGLYPTDGRSLGREVPIGQGKVDFPRILARLWALDFDGEVVIEREIRGPQQGRDIRKSVMKLRRMIARLK